MRKWAKPKIIIPTAIILISLGLWAGFKVLGWLNYRFGKYLIPYRGTYYWCDPEELIVKLEGRLDLKFPDDFRDIKAAKTPVLEGSVSFLIRFTAEPNVMNAFFNSFPREVIFEEYTPSEDIRSNLPSALDWFMKPIRKGKFAIAYNTPRVNSIIYIDITNEKWYVVYWYGSYY